MFHHAVLIAPSLGLSKALRMRVAVPEAILCKFRHWSAPAVDAYSNTTLPGDVQAPVTPLPPFPPAVRIAHLLIIELPLMK